MRHVRDEAESEVVTGSIDSLQQYKRRKIKTVDAIEVGGIYRTPN